MIEDNNADSKMKCAIMFADIAGSTRLYEQLGDKLAADCVQQSLNEMIRITSQNSGTVINTIGDEILCRFVNVADAVRAARNIQERAVAGPMNSHNIRISLRIGIHYGLIINREEDVYGDVVNVAARVANIAVGGQILTTEQVVHQLNPGQAQKTRRFDQIEIKGKQAPLVLYEVLWEERDITTMRSQLLGLHANQSLELVYQGEKRILLPSSPPFVLGRSPESDLVVAANLVSRIHAYCTYRRGKFILIDQSTNGTFVQVDDNPEIYLRREEIPLVGRGVIGLGESLIRDNGQVVEFEIH